jgi:glucokinase
MSRKRASRRTDVLGIDLGATKISAALMDPAGRVSSHGGRTLHRNEGPDEVIRDLIQVVRRAFGKDAPVGAIGIGVAGQVDADSGMVSYAPNLRWKDVPLGARLTAEFGCPVVVANDVRAATVGEWRHGAGKGGAEILCLFIGTGIGGSVVSGGRLLTGASNAAGEVGHSVLVAGGRPCHCSARGCLEAYVGGWAIAERARERVRSDPAGGVELRRRAGSVAGIDARMVGEAAHAGDPLSIEVMRETGDYLAAGVVGLVNAFNPSRVLLGGGIIEGSPEVMEPVIARVRSECQPPAAQAARVLRVALGHDATLVGAAELARDRLHGRSGPRSRRAAR